MLWPHSATATMIIVEPMDCYTARSRMPQPLPSTPAETQKTPPTPAAPRRLPNDDFWTEIVFEILKSNGDSPLRITSVVNETQKWGKFANRTDRVEHKKKMFKVIGRLIRMGRLDRYKRNLVVTPTSDARYQAFLALASRPLDLPPPNV